VEAERLLPAGSVGPVAASDVLLGVRQLLRPLCAQHGVELRFGLPDRAPPILGERVALRQALLAILGSAIGTATDASIAVALSFRAGQAEIRISGSAAGGAFPARASIEESRPFVEAIGGRLTTLPPHGPADTWAVCLAFPASTSPTLLVVDNDLDFIQLVERYLVSHQWEVIGAGSVDQACTQVEQQAPQAILLDVVIPGRDGWELMLELKTAPTTRDIPVIVCSVLKEPQVALSLGAAAYLHKPVTQQQLVSALTRLG
jgi:CheY-like chemotaxis protein